MDKGLENMVKYCPFALLQIVTFVTRTLHLDVV
jgi:hypothetical protein